MTDDTREGTGDLQALVDRLLVKDREAHESAIESLADRGDERVIPHLVEVATVHAVATDWETFGFPEVLRNDRPPRCLRIPEARWPGAIEALNAIGEPTYRSPAAWLQWESWTTEQAIDPLAGFGDWKTRLYRSYHPTVGHLLDTPGLDPTTVRWGNTDSASLHPLNGPQFTEDTGYLRDDDLVFGFELDGQAYAVPRYLIFPHELLNAEIGGRPISLTYCTMCNSPICYDRRVEGGKRTLTFGSTGLIRQGNKLMFDEETLTLWSQHRGVPVAGPYAGHDPRERLPDDVREPSLAFLPVTQTDFGEWQTDHPDTLVVDPDTGYDFDYEYYRDYEGFIRRHYWENEKVSHPGVAPAESEAGVDDKTYVYGIDIGDSARVYPVEMVRNRGVVVDAFDGRRVVVVARNDDVTVYDAPTGNITRDGDVLLDGQGRRWTITSDALEREGGSGRLMRVPGRHGLWMAFRVGYDDATVVTGDGYPR